jgi:putative transposase
MPYYGAPRMTTWLKDQGYPVNQKRIARLMSIMGIQGIVPKRKLSIHNKEHMIYPYLLRGVDIVRPNQVFSSDITYIPMRKGFIYLTAVMDWFSRYVLSWNILKHCTMPLPSESPRSSIPTRDPNLRARILRTH